MPHPNPNPKKQRNIQNVNKQGAIPQKVNQTSNQAQPPLPDDERRLTKEGDSDRRYNENRSIPNMKNAGSLSVSIHRTKDGKPDRRFRENVGLTEKEAEILHAKHILEQAERAKEKMQSNQQNIRRGNGNVSIPKG